LTRPATCTEATRPPGAQPWSPSCRPCRSNRKHAEPRSSEL